jgi:hypothetical protein
VGKGKKRERKRARERGKRAPHEVCTSNTPGVDRLAHARVTRRPVLPTSKGRERGSGKIALADRDEPDGRTSHTPGVDRLADARVSRRT